MNVILLATITVQIIISSSNCNNVMSTRIRDHNTTMIEQILHCGSIFWYSFLFCPIFAYYV